MAMAEFRNNQMLKEWAPLSDLLHKLPRKVHTGLLSQEVKITCIDVVSEFIALATNVGVVYWYSRIRKDFEVLRCEPSNSRISVIRVISTVDYMLACGTLTGCINIFQIPKSLPENLPDNLKRKKQMIERYTVSDMHKSAISALEWSRNGMKLFSGDKTGSVVQTELDFYMNICKSIDILHESYEVVQLSYYQQYLLVSTTYRSIICEKDDKWKLTQIGKKDRKVFGKYGGIIRTDMRPNNLQLYCSRPGLRIWISDLLGNVQKTLLFKDALNKDNLEKTFTKQNTTLLKLHIPINEVCFGTLLTFQEELLITYCSTAVFVLDPYQMAVVHVFHSLKGILAVATDKDEIFILEEGRSVRRLAYRPESTSDQSSLALPVSTLSLLPSSISMLEITLEGYSIPQKCGFHESRLNLESQAEEALECTEAMNESHYTGIKSRQNDSVSVKNSEMYSKISQEDYDDKIIVKHRSRTKPLGDSCASNENFPTSAISNAVFFNRSATPILPDLRSPESIKNDIEKKEQLIAKLLDFDKIKFTIQTEDKDCNKGNAPEDKCSVVVEETAQLHFNSTNSNIAALKNECEIKSSKDEIVTNEVVQNSTIPIVPDVISIPNEWNLSCVQLQTETPRSEIDNVLKDWEII